MHAGFSSSPPPVLTRDEADGHLALGRRIASAPQDSRRAWALALAGGAVVALALSLIVSAIAWGAAQRQAGALDGMCIALDMAMAHGAIDDATRALVTETIASPANPYFDRIEVQGAELAHRCRDMAAARWNW